MSGRCTLSATSCPLSRSLQRYTCPRLAAAIGVDCSSRPSKSSFGDVPSSASMRRSACSVGYEGTASHNF